MHNKKGFSGISISLLIIGILILFLVIYAVIAYNRFVSLDQDVNGKWSEVENQYQRQADLIPNLVSIVSSSVKVETAFIQNVTESRSRWQNARTPVEKDVAGLEMNNGITALVNAVSIAENYPSLQANKQYVALTDEISGTQNRITVARGRYIQSLQNYNTAIRKFPANSFASLYGFKKKEYYQANEGSLQTPSIGEGKLP